MFCACHGSRAAAAIAVAMFALDPDVLYLQSTPMTEPLLFGLVLLSISLVYDWVEDLRRALTAGLYADRSEGRAARRARARRRDGASSSHASHATRHGS